MQVGDLVAVYGSLRNGLGNSRILEGTERLEDGIIEKNKYSMISLVAFPGLLKDNLSNTEIVVEVYEIDSVSRKRRLDNLEGYPSFYNREEVKLVDGRTAWVYYLEGNHYQSRPKVHSGDWVEYIKNNTED